MKIAIPTSEGRLCQHFGHCQQFALVAVEDDTKTIAGVTMLTPPPHAPGVLPRWVAENGANLVIAGGIGQNAISGFAMAGVKVIVGAPVDSPENLVTAYLAGTLTAGDNVCDH